MRTFHPADRRDTNAIMQRNNPCCQMFIFRPFGNKQNKIASTFAKVRKPKVFLSMMGIIQCRNFFRYKR